MTDEMQCVAAVAQWCSAVKVVGCVARRREMQLVVWLAVYGGGNDHGWVVVEKGKSSKIKEKATGCEK